MIANGGSTVFFLACVASVSFGFGTKEFKKDQGTGFLVSAAREMEREPKKMKEGGGGGKGSFPPHLLPWYFTGAIFRAVFDSRSSFFAPKPHGEACYAGYIFSDVTFIALPVPLHDRRTYFFPSSRLDW